MEEQIVIGKGTWIDKLADTLIKREKKLGRNLGLIRVESGLGASGIPHIGSMADAVRAYGIALALQNFGEGQDDLFLGDAAPALRAGIDAAVAGTGRFLFQLFPERMVVFF